MKLRELIEGIELFERERTLTESKQRNLISIDEFLNYCENEPKFAVDKAP